MKSPKQYYRLHQAINYAVGKCEAFEIVCNDGQCTHTAKNSFIIKDKCGPAVRTVVTILKRMGGQLNATEYYNAVEDIDNYIVNATDNKVEVIYNMSERIDGVRSQVLKTVANEYKDREERKWVGKMVDKVLKN